MSTGKRLFRNPQGKVIGGVCTGLGDYFSLDYTIIRIIWLLMVLFGGFGVLLYLICWIIIPENTFA